MFLNSLIKKLLYQYKVKITDTGQQLNKKLYKLIQNYKHMFIIKVSKMQLILISNL